MTQELHYTSVPRGLKPGARGFCTVACTAGLSPTLAERLEGLSGYRAKYTPDHDRANDNPIAWSHLRLSAAGQTLSVVSRVGPAGLDYTDRPNKYAHHVVLDVPERPAGGPAWLLAQPGFMASQWTEAPQQIPEGRRSPSGDRPGGICRAWAAQTGDAGWAGVIAESFLNDPRRPVVLVFDPGTDVLPLFAEALALLPRERRWDVTFQTYFTGMPPGVTCAWRGVLRDSAEERQARGNPEALLIDLAMPEGQATGGSLVHWARTGEAPTAGSVSEAEPDRPYTATASAPAASKKVRTAAAGATDHDPYALGPPPAPTSVQTGSLTRERRPREASGGGGRRSPWPIVAAAAIAFVLGTVFGGAGVFFVLQSRPSWLPLAWAGSSSSERERASPGPAPSPATPPEARGGSGRESGRPGNASTNRGTDGEGKNRRTNELAKGSIKTGESSQQLLHQGEKPTEQPERNSTAKQRIGDSPRIPPPAPPATLFGKGGNTASDDKTEKVARSGKPDGRQGEDEQDDREPIRLGYKQLNTGDPDDLGKSNKPREPLLAADQPIRGLSLIGGRDSALDGYSFSTQAMSFGFLVSEDKREKRQVASFRWQGTDVFFGWSEKGQAAALRRALTNCVLRVSFTGSENKYFLLQKLDLVPPPRRLNERSENLRVELIKKMRIYKFNWFQNPGFLLRKPVLYSFSLIPERDGLAFNKPQPKAATLNSSNPSDGLSVHLREQPPWEVEVIWKKNVRTTANLGNLDRQIKGLTEGITFMQNSGQKLSQFGLTLDQMKSQLSSVQKLRDEAGSQLELEQRIEASGICATVGLTIGGKQFVLPELISPGSTISEEAKR